MKTQNNHWILIIIIIGTYFTLVHWFNNKENIIKRLPKSLFKAEEEQLLITISPYPVLKSNSAYTSNNDFSSFHMKYPDNWFFSVDSNVDFTKTTIRPNDSADKSCIIIYQSTDNMPLLEAVNFNQFMIEQNGQPFFLKESVETTISGQPAHTSKLQIDSNNPDIFVHNAVIVKNNTYTTILRSCEGTKDELFYPILKSFEFVE